MFWKKFISLLVLIVFLIWLSALKYDGSNLHVVACDVGQGDAILITQGASQVLIDGGPDSRVLECLGEYLPFWDRKIELVVMTHPQKDHYGGLTEVMDRYQVDSFLKTDATSSSQDFEVLERMVGGGGIKVIQPKTGLDIRVGLMYLEIVYPPENVNIAEDRDPNDFSVVLKLKYGEFDALFTGDMGPNIVSEVIGTGLIGDIEYLKVPHHGSKNGLTQEMLEATTPEVAVVSAGRNNRYGHPHQEVLGMLDDIGVNILRTDLVGSVEVVTNGSTFWVEN
ncbi:MAG: Competence protein ComEC [Candidatus Woesebacteria bacterium GW2011_GWB1_43_14]|uniref:Competence protein ComEC n=1 Tax=Candidatus Woesebacteria bacterium GW2011_GWB1_43_14 TaxID=1618578 RepID=A0A0G1FPD1_9BACT|nr:MAG: Competence protein ComEC [Candidatus Woesebacteria bacterium GW2011_GWC1_42_9]KKS96886.1 MAG: Competence protein ComEC [Candidatus Woesebacteria bacterium GW2011_GWB1_43_14]